MTDEPGSQALGHELREQGAVRAVGAPRGGLRRVSGMCLAMWLLVSSVGAQVNFVGTPVAGSNPLTVTFTNLTSGGSPIGWQWNFGDGQFSSDEDPVHTYTTPGVFTVSLTALLTPETGVTHSKPAYIQVIPVAYTAGFTLTPGSGTLPLTVAFSDTTSGVTPTGWQWDFGDGSGSTEQHPEHTYTTPGTYTVSLDVAYFGQTESLNQPDAVTVDAVPLSASFDVSTSAGPLPLEVAFSDTTSGVTPTSWQWDFGDGSGSAEQHPTHLYTAPGSYSVALTATYFGQSDTHVETDLIQVQPVPLEPSFTFVDTPGEAPHPVAFTDTTSGTTPQTWLWDFGDGATSAEQHPEHVYLADGVYSVSLSVSFYEQQASVVAPDLITVAYVPKTFVVPTDVATIQGAIELCQDEDSVHVLAGTYPEALSLGGRSIAIVGLDGAAATVVDASGLGLPVLTSDGPVPAVASVSGLTLRGAQTAEGGAGVRVEVGQVSLTDCVVRDNIALSGAGGGVGVVFGAEAVLSGCQLIANQAITGGGAAGPVSLDGCEVLANQAVHGGGLHRPSAVIDTLIEGNVATGNGGGLNGDGLADLAGSLFRQNSAGLDGGGLWATNEQQTLGLRRCRFEDNIAGGAGGGAWLRAGLPSGFAGALVFDAVFVDNQAGVPDSTGLFMEVAVVPQIPLMFQFVVSNCTFVDNTVLLTASNIIRVENCIYRGVPGGLQTVPTGNYPESVTYSNLQGYPSAASSVIDVDPLFVDAAARDLHLQPGSPCINTGKPGGLGDPDGSTRDMGAYPFHPWEDLGAGLAGALGEPVLFGNGALTDGAPGVLELSGAAPFADSFLVLGASAANAPFKQGLLVPSPDLLPGLLVTDAQGAVPLAFTWPAGFGSGLEIWAQSWVRDVTAPAGWAASNALKATTP